MNEDVRSLLVEVLTHTERLDKITVKLDDASRTVTIVYEDLDDTDYRQLRGLMAEPPSAAQ